MQNRQRICTKSLFGTSCAELPKLSHGSIFSPAQDKKLGRSEQGEVYDVTLEAMDVLLKCTLKPNKSYYIYCIIQIKHFCP